MVAAQRFISRRRGLFLAAVCVAALGLAVHFLLAGGFGSLFADALYTVLAYLVLAWLFPGAARHLVAWAAFAVSALIELAQLTGLPAQLAVDFPPSRLILGTTFSAPDLLAYAAGALAIWLVDVLVSGKRPQLHAPQLE
ncbi:DUF2809 domain-containing protein [Specibacter sp. NPDC057265]|uniref:ribosomal maturation YjgA family protein n=1 Tax=Specibacter sp. NPDC057265 TaxID=3346075 RepID=UPI00362AB93A